MARHGIWYNIGIFVYKRGGESALLLRFRRLEQTGIMSEKENQIVVYQPNETVRLDVRLENETVWLNRHQMAQLFGRDVKTIGKHIANALSEELSQNIVAGDYAPTQVPSNATVAKFATVQDEGGRAVVRQVEYYSLDVILSVGYRVKSSQGILFRQWATKVLRDYLLRGYSINAKMSVVRLPCLQSLSCPRGRAMPGNRRDRLSMLEKCA